MADKIDLNNLSFKDLFNRLKNKITGNSDEMLSGQLGKYEVNLVPQVKLKLIAMQKLRNLVIFICLIVLAVCGGSLLVTSSIVGGQNIRMATQDSHLKNLSDKIMSYDELSEFLTLQNQLNKMTDLDEQKKVLSRVFNIIAAILPTGKDRVTLSELNVNLGDSTLAFDAQADAGEEPNIDYRVLEAFKKAANMMNYDYGRYVDDAGNDIPARCIIETDENGEMYSDKGAVYAIWTRGRTGCDPQRDDFRVDEEDGGITILGFTQEMSDSRLDNTRFTGENMGFGTVDLKDEDEDEDDGDDRVTANTRPGQSGDSSNSNSGFNSTNGSSAGNSSNAGSNGSNTGNGSGDNKVEIVDVVLDEKIWRTPQFNTWYDDGKSNKKTVVDTSKDGVMDIETDTPVMSADGTKLYNYINYKYEPEMTLDGAISGVPHFESRCITYSGELDSDDKVKWNATNDCKISAQDIMISNSSNGRDSDDNLVLKFSAVITLDPNMFAFKNKHVMVVALTGQNVTDSYMQIDNMFAEPAVDCDPKDTVCKTNTKNETGE